MMSLLNQHKLRTSQLQSSLAEMDLSVLVDKNLNMCCQCPFVAMTSASWNVLGRKVTTGWVRCFFPSARGPDKTQVEFCVPFLCPFLNSPAQDKCGYMGWSTAERNKDDLEAEPFFTCGETERTRVVKPWEEKAQKEHKPVKNTDGKQ